ncbi:hypothetical protein [Streptomyces fuscichromogenes]|uniref:hypothetical protein n=1 Tax=Streptomyces fuscichromogenes TaxID=1324013 RepID=UPI001670C2DD|nr:hypothetical protein [Streptomyces fuscichromogenes]
MDVALARPVAERPGVRRGLTTSRSTATGPCCGGPRTDDGVRLQARTRRDVTAHRMDLAVAAGRLPPGVILDGVM